MTAMPVCKVKLIEDHRYFPILFRHALIRRTNRNRYDTARSPSSKATDKSTSVRTSQCLERCGTGRNCGLRDLTRQALRDELLDPKATRRVSTDRKLEVLKLEANRRWNILGGGILNV